MKLFRFLASKTFWANLLIAVVAVALLFWGISKLTDVYTLHGDNITVPNLSRLSISEASTRLQQLGLNPEILDSAEFTTAYPRGSVIDQYPNPGALVKEDRKILLTVNPMKPGKIELPQLVEKTKRRAIYDLESKGFKVGNLTYVPYIGKDVVVDVKIDGKSVKEKQRFDKGTVVDLILGQGLENKKIIMPYLRFLTLDQAKEKLLTYSLNVGSIMYDDDITDTTTAKVYKQYPDPSLRPSVYIGAEVDLWLTNDYTKIPNDSLPYLHANDMDTTDINLLNDTLNQSNPDK